MSHLAGILAGKKQPKPGPTASAEFRRIDALPRRIFTESEEDADLVTRWLTLPGATGRALPLQASAVIECVDNAGGLGMVGVGQGKTMLSILLCEAFAREHGVTRPGILVPSGAKQNTLDTIATMYREGWDLRIPIIVIGFADLHSPDKGPTLLDDLGLDMIVLDEADQFRDPNTPRTERLLSYLRRRRPFFIPMSGTMNKTGPLDIAHLLRHAIGDACTPLPHWPELMDWHAALAAKPFGPPGVLWKWKQSNETLPAAWGRRLRETPGVFHSDGVPTDVKLTIRLIRVDTPKIRDVVEVIATEFRAGDEELPDHLAQNHALNAAAHGHFQRLRWPAGMSREAIAAWYEARTAWTRFVRDQRRRKGLDTEALVRRAVEAGDRFGALQAYAEQTLAAWRACEVAPVSVVEYFSDEMTAIVRDWVNVDRSHGCVWVTSPEAGKRLADACGVPFFGAGQERGIIDHRGACVASIAAHGVGRNLQHHSRALVLAAQADGVRWQQLLGRHHRRGALRNVCFDVVITHDVFLDRIKRALAHADWLEEQSAERQRLTLAEKINFPIAA